MLWTGDVEDAKSIDDLITSASQEDQFQTSRILISRLQADSGKSSQETSRNKSPRQKAKLYQRRDHLRADRLLGWSMTCSKLVATMKPSWTSEIYRGFNGRTTTLKPSTQSGRRHTESPNEHWPCVIQRMQSLLTEMVLACSLLFPFVFPLFEAPIAGLSSSRFLELKWESCRSVSDCWWYFKLEPNKKGKGKGRPRSPSPTSSPHRNSKSDGKRGGDGGAKKHTKTRW